MRPRRPLIPTFVVAATAVAVLAAGCGGGSSPPTSSAGPTPRRPMSAREVVAFAACMRSHGLSSYPDPQVSSRPTTCRSRSRPAARSQLPGVQVRHTCLRPPPARRRRTGLPTAPRSKRRTCASRPACARTESRASPTPTTTEPSPSPPGSTSRRPSSSARRKRARTSSQARSRSSTNLQAAPDAARTSAARAAARLAVRARSAYAPTRRAVTRNERARPRNRVNPSPPRGPKAGTRRCCSVAKAATRPTLPLPAEGRRADGQAPLTAAVGCVEVDVATTSARGEHLKPDPPQDARSGMRPGSALNARGLARVAHGVFAHFSQ